MADPRRFELDELLIRPGTYFNPQTEVLIVVDDSPELDAEIFDVEDVDGADWFAISDEVPIDEHQRDELLEAFSIRHQPGRIAAHGGDDDEIEDEEDDELDEDEEEHEDE